MKADRVEIVIATTTGHAPTRSSRRAGRRVEIATGRGIVEVAGVTPAGEPVRTARLMASRVLALVEHPAADAGATWTDIGQGLPSDFGFPLALDPLDADSAYVIPLTADTDRVTPGGEVRVYETRDAGAGWTARGGGLPRKHAYLTILREAFDSNGEGETLELYFGATSGDVFGSGDAGSSWSTVATRLPPVLSIAAR